MTPEVGLGPKRSDTLSTRLYCTAKISLNGSWEEVASNDRDYPYSWYLPMGFAGGPAIAPTESWTAINSLDFQAYNLPTVNNLPTTNLNFKLLIYYGGENPAEADFLVKQKK